MRLLLDTHAFLWFVLNDPRLSSNALQWMTDASNELYLSPVAYWEIAIKVSLRKYSLPGDFADFMERQVTDNYLTILPITIRHVATVATLPFHHRDPFDRLLIAQAMTEGIPLISVDAVFDTYPVTRMW